MLPVKLCSGCTACAAVCPRHCIDMLPDQDGFLYPRVTADTCIHCKKCERVCPVLNHVPPVKKPLRTFAAKNKDEDCRINSSSGGIFSALAEDVLGQGGIIFGAAVSTDNTIEHQTAESIQELAHLRGSKYVSSQLGDSFRLVQQNLEAGRTVLFSGTPCQVEGLLAFLGHPYNNLLTIDLICHGVPSAKVWADYCKFQEKKYQSQIQQVSFRNKDRGWKEFSMKLKFANHTVYTASLREDPFLQAFLINLCLRPSCHDCIFKNQNRKSDITLADFWGIQELMPKEDDDRGLSLVFSHTERGMNALLQLRDKIILKEVDSEAAVAHNGAMLKSVKPHHFREYFFHELGKYNFDKLVQNCIQPSYFVRLHRKILENKKRKTAKECELSWKE